jgi:hypothetical protein
MAHGDGPRLKCDEAPEEEPSIQSEKSFKVDCNITGTTNFMHSGILSVSPIFISLIMIES